MDGHRDRQRKRRVKSGKPDESLLIVRGWNRAVAGFARIQTDQRSPRARLNAGSSSDSFFISSTMAIAAKYRFVSRSGAEEETRFEERNRGSR
jgi:hypothetical protein